MYPPRAARVFCSGTLNASSESFVKTLFALLLLSASSSMLPAKYVIVKILRVSRRHRTRAMARSGQAFRASQKHLLRYCFPLPVVTPANILSLARCCTVLLAKPFKPGHSRFTVHIFCQIQLSYSCRAASACNPYAPEISSCAGIKMNMSPTWAALTQVLFTTHHPGQ